MSRPRIEAFTIPEAAKAAGVHPHTIARYIHSGRILANRIGKKWEIPKGEIDRLKDNRARQIKKKREKTEARGTKYKEELKAAFSQAITESFAPLTKPERLKEEIDDLSEEKAQGIAAVFAKYLGDIVENVGKAIDQTKSEEEAKKIIEAAFVALDEIRKSDWTKDLGGDK